MLNWEWERWREVGEATAQVLVALCFFQVLHYAVRWYLYGKWTFPSFSYFGIALPNDSGGNGSPMAALSPNKKWRISNEIVSLIHSAMSGVWAALICAFFPEMFGDMVFWYHRFSRYLILMSTGYMFHDLLDLLINERSVRILELLFHHVIVLTAFFTTLLTERFLGVVICGLLMEVNSIFLHSRSLLNLFGCEKTSTMFRLIGLLNMLTLFIFRMAVSIYLLVWQMTSFQSLSWHLALVTFVVIASLAITNTVLAYRVLAADGYLGASRARAPPPDANKKTAAGVVLVPLDAEE